MSLDNIKKEKQFQFLYFYSIIQRNNFTLKLLLRGNKEATTDEAILTERWMFTFSDKPRSSTQYPHVHVVDLLREGRIWERADER